MLVVKLEWATPNIDKRITWMARVSNPAASPDDPHEKLIKYLIDHKHWSPLEMVDICLKIETTRDIARQILRHRSFHFQEFSQRYSAVDQDKPIISEARLQDTKNRQNSLVESDPQIQDSWLYWQNRVWDCCWLAYNACLRMGIAKELARKLLPEGLTKTTMFMKGTVRDWYHYTAIRTGPETQYEHRIVAQEILGILKEISPAVFGGKKFSGQQ